MKKLNIKNDQFFAEAYMQFMESLMIFKELRAEDSKYDVPDILGVGNAKHGTYEFHLGGKNGLQLVAISYKNGLLI